MAQQNKTKFPDKSRSLAKMMSQNPERLAEAAEQARLDMEQISAKVRDLVLTQPPIQLLSCFVCQFHIAMMYTRASESQRPDPGVIRSFQLALEYLHAIWSCHAPLVSEEVRLDEASVARLLDLFARLDEVTTQYCMLSSASSRNTEKDQGHKELEFHAKTSWALIRGNRYQVLEEEFFEFVLQPHDDELYEVYGVRASEIASGVQAISNTMRSGVADAAEKMSDYMERVSAITDEKGEELDQALQRIDAEDSSFKTEAADAIKDMLFGGTCNLSRHSNLPPKLLEDLSYSPGENTEFFAPGEFSGTPMRTLPARVKPGIRLGEDFYATDGQFVRDSAYRSIQRGLISRLPTYRDTWLKRQGDLIEEAFSAIFSHQFAGAETIRSVHYREVSTGKWVETDRVILIGDVMLVIEAKAGNLPMQSPATNFASHERIISGLLVKAYEQCKRFIDYLSSANQVPLYKLENGTYTEIRRLRIGAFREVLPIGLTVEAFTPFSAMSKELPGIIPIQNKYPFVSMSVDDLFLLSRFLKTTGELIHYLCTRQKVAGIPQAMLFDEIDHLGAYIHSNRFDITLKEQLHEASMVTWDAFSHIVDSHFEVLDWEEAPIPTQNMPARYSEILNLLNWQRPNHWLRFDSHLRDGGEEFRNNVVGLMARFEPALEQHPRRRFNLAGEEIFQIWLCRVGEEPLDDELRRYAQASCLIFEKTLINVLVLSYREVRGGIAFAKCDVVRAPTILQKDLAEIKRLADEQRKSVRPI